MKIKIYVLMILLFAGIVSAEPFSMKIDGNDIMEVDEINAGENVDYELRVEKGVKIYSIRVDSSNPVYEEFFEELLNRDYPYSEEGDIVEKGSALIPSYAPAGKTNLKITVRSSEGELIKEKDIEVKGGSKTLGIISKFVPRQTIKEIIADMQKEDPEPVKEELGVKDLSESERKELGLEEGDVPQIDEIDSSEKEVSFEDISSFVKQAAAENENLAAELKELEGEFNPSYKVKRTRYTVTHDGKTIEKTKTVLKVGGEDMLNLVVIAIIPKSYAKNVDGLEFSEKASVVEEDPIVKWTFNGLDKDQEKGYTITSEEYSDEDIVVVTSADKPGFLTKIIRKIVGMFVNA